MINDEAGTVLVWELIDAFGGDDLDKLDMSIFDGELRQMLIYQVAELVAVLVKMQQYKVLSWCVSNFSDILISGDFNNLSILDLLSLGLKLGDSVGIKLLGELIILIKLILHIFQLLFGLAIDDILDLVLFSMLLLHLFLLFVKGGLLLFGKVVAMLYLDVKPFCCYFVCHFVLVYGMSDSF